jgi:hypothetical protein
MIAAYAAADGVEHLDISFGKDFPAIHAWHNRPFKKRPHEYKHREFVVKVHGTFWSLAPFGLLVLGCRIAAPRQNMQSAVIARLFTQRPAARHPGVIHYDP